MTLQTISTNDLLYHLNARDRDFIPTLTTTLLSAAMTVEDTLAGLDASNLDRDV
jgi:hypothetical protein